ncbi:hypothetical protein PRIPAC_72107 [Pristionchus pacificus]|uniref:Uncharacterized protein n=1 Tax=Pristionchus pacificus TaxID=54126 RepID=A0A2A6CSN2_PRIPA|nr:hypothetical protein PRIPAC_72107 [Pristionchus pacificus]|eukprot:PDM81077.1 hypothetical protein PRIPAC_36080 [Pristionchus pacificus]
MKNKTDSRSLQIMSDLTIASDVSNGSFFVHGSFFVPKENHDCECLFALCTCSKKTQLLNPEFSELEMNQNMNKEGPIKDQAIEEKIMDDERMICFKVSNIIQSKSSPCLSFLLPFLVYTRCLQRKEMMLKGENLTGHLNAGASEQQLQLCQEEMNKLFGEAFDSTIQ